MRPPIPCLLAAALASIPGLAFGAPCPAVDDAARTRTLSFAQALFRDFAGGEDLRIVGETLDSATCYTEFTFATSSASEPFTRRLFLSPDHRYLTAAVYPVALPDDGRPGFVSRLLNAFLRQHHIPVLGSPSAPDLIVVFASYNCATCADLAQSLRDDLPPEVKDKTRIAFLFAPEENRDWGAGAAAVAACAAAQSEPAYWSMHNFLVENRDQLSAENLEPASGAFSLSIAGLDHASFTRCVSSHESRPEVEAQAALARSLGAVILPAVFLNGYQWIGPATAAQLRDALKKIPDNASPAGEPR
jgi:hypothetical protein